MRTIGIQVRKNPLVVSFDVFVDTLGRTLNQDDFQNTASGIYTYQQQVDQVGDTMTVTLEIFGAGSNVARPTAVCLTSLDGAVLSPYVATSILANKSKASNSVVYHVGDSFTAGGEHEVAMLAELAPTNQGVKPALNKKKGKQ